MIPGAIKQTAPHGSEPLAGLRIRDAGTEDMAAVQAIYAQHVLRSSATFEEVPPALHEMRARREHVLQQGLPYLVAALGGEIAGYCYASAYRPRVAYRHTIEDSIYLADGRAGMGLGKALLSALLARCEQGPWRQMIAVIGGTNNSASIALHRSLGFKHVGTQPSIGFKFNQWIDVVLMQRALGEGDATLPTASRR
ncbi:GNAT family N-acetyltransferase [Candidimonas nitroreducens]|uniref:GNAT family N-acetyltransferase n=1 Tax=Candidimonas nitroreducens TaxID=683354 RepID=A0A225MAL1_9BURK|nr:GNAT family N-acetyltransferase [Candidimonas nitroreducens]OWT58337.1 GNAT family N-acetyltransferase [Candidimonas nitroreducens]